VRRKTAIQAYYILEDAEGLVVTMGEEEIAISLSFEENGVQDGARLQVTLPVPLWSRFCSLIKGGGRYCDDDDETKGGGTKCP